MPQTRPAEAVATSNRPWPRFGIERGLSCISSGHTTTGSAALVDGTEKVRVPTTAADLFPPYQQIFLFGEGADV